MPANADRLIRRWALTVAIAEVAFSLPLWWRLVPAQPGWQFAERREWLPGLGASYHLGVDGISMLLVLLTTVLTAVAVLGAFRAVEKHGREVYALPLPAAMQGWLFLAFAFAFAIKVPMFPFHTWLPDAHVEAPTAGSVILAAVLLKMGTYGFLRFAIPLFPIASAQYTPWLVALALVGIIYGALVAMVQPDLKKLVAYSSVSHLGFCMLGLYAMNPQGFAGAMLQMLNHGVSTGALFLLVGVVYERRHSRLISDFVGAWHPLPVV